MCPHRRAYWSACFAAGLVISWTSTAAANYEIRSFQRSPDTVATDFWDINNAGVIVGDSCSGACSVSQPFSFSAGVYSPVALPSGGIGGNAFGISDGGAIVGAYSTDAVRSHGFIAQGGSSSAFDVPGAVDTYLRGISPDGRYISGYSSTFDTGIEVTTPFVFDRTTGQLQQFTGSIGLVQGINSSGLLVGNLIVDGEGRRSGLVYNIHTQLQTMHNFPLFEKTNFRDINDAGLIAGWLLARLDTPTTSSTAFVGTANGSFTELSLPGAFGMVAEGINNAGTVVGFYNDDTGKTYAFIATGIPEPSVYALMVVGLLALGLIRRPNKAKANFVSHAGITPPVAPALAPAATPAPRRRTGLSRGDSAGNTRPPRCADAESPGATRPGNALCWVPHP